MKKFYTTTTKLCLCVCMLSHVQLFAHPLNEIVNKTLLRAILQWKVDELFK